MSSSHGSASQQSCNYGDKGTASWYKVWVQVRGGAGRVVADSDGVCAKMFVQSPRRGEDETRDQVVVIQTDENRPTFARGDNSRSNENQNLG